VGTAASYFAGASDGIGDSENAVLYGLEGGYEFRVASFFTLRPQCGFGGASITNRLGQPTSSNNVPPPTAVGGTPVARTGSVHRTPTDLAKPDVITQASGVGTTTVGSTPVGAGAYTSTTVRSFYVEPAVTALFWITPRLYAGLSGSVLWFPSVSYGSDGSTPWVSYASRLQAGMRF
jgi:hypothetical protein